MQKGIESLHSHTLYSDGKLTHFDVLDIAQRLGISVIAFTDHDALPEAELVSKLKETKSPVKWLIGIEISAGLPSEMGGGVDGPHIIGLFIDPTNKALLSHCQKSQEERMTRMRKIVKNFQKYGFDITEKDCLNFTKGKSVGLPHIVMALKSKGKNLQLISEYKEKMRKAAKNNQATNESYNRMVQQGETQYPYALFLGDYAFFPGFKVPYQYWLDFDKSVQLIRDAGGIASIAHYATVKKELNFAKIEQILKEDRVDGMETVYGLWKYGTDETEDITKERERVRKLLKEYDKLPTGGADAHDEKDFTRFAQEKWYNQETEGMVENIMSKKKISKEWSNF
jgi:predicted metal-dependent phosphoesterase TrpH